MCKQTEIGGFLGRKSIPSSHLLHSTAGPEAQDLAVSSADIPGSPSSKTDSTGNK